MPNRNFEFLRDREEDNDDVVTIIDAKTSIVKEFYGEFYVSEMVRHPDNCRRLIVSEDDEGLATGVMFLNSNIDLDALNENFELIPYNGLRKPHEMDKYPKEIIRPASEIFFSIFSRTPRDEPTKQLVLLIPLFRATFLLHRLSSLLIHRYIYGRLNLFINIAWSILYFLTKVNFFLHLFFFFFLRNKNVVIVILTFEYNWTKFQWY